MKLIETVAAIQTGRASVAPTTAGLAEPAAPKAARPKPDAVADISTRRRRRRNDPPLPM